VEAIWITTQGLGGRAPCCQG